jgi:hypothetical protein
MARRSQSRNRPTKACRGIICYLRPESQKSPKAKTARKLTWPKGLSAAVQSVLISINGPSSEDDVAKRFNRASKVRIAELLGTRTSLGKARELDDGRYCRCEVAATL